jgi:hypothetical protein
LLQSDTVLNPPVFGFLKLGDVKFTLKVNVHEALEFGLESGKFASGLFRFSCGEIICLGLPALNDFEEPFLLFCRQDNEPRLFSD